MGLSVRDFEVLTPEEFNAIYKEWRSGVDSETRGRWERCRWICYHILKPYAKRSLRPTDVMSFEWDGSGRGAKTKMTKEDLAKEKKEFEHLMEIWKDE